MSDIRTPPLRRRLLAIVYEIFLVCAYLLVGFVLPHILMGVYTHKLMTGFFLWIHLFLLLLAYFVWFWSHGRQTLPMKTWRMRLTNRQGRPLHATQALLRYLLCWPSLLLFGIGILWALVDKDALFLHDRLAGTRLIEDRPIAS